MAAFAKSWRREVRARMNRPPPMDNIAHSTAFGLTRSVLVFGSHGFLSERKFSIAKFP
jgi:hypothetical protein